MAGASVLGISALCYYGLGLSNESGAIDRSMYVVCLQTFVGVCVIRLMFLAILPLKLSPS